MSNPIGSQDDPEVSAAGSASVIAILKRIRTLLASVVTLAFDSTNKLRVSLYGKNAAAGDTALVAHSTGALQVMLQTAGAGIIAQSNSTADSDNGPGWTIPVVAILKSWNGGAFDVLRCNTSLTLLASAARTATTNSSNQFNYNGRGIMLIVDVSARAVATTLTPAIQIRDSVSGNYKTIWTAAAAINTASGTFAYVLYPGAASAASFTEVIQAVLSRTWRLSVAHSDGDSITYSASAENLL